METLLTILRESRRFSTGDMAERLGMPEEEYCALELGQTPLTAAQAKVIGHVFDGPANHFYDENTVVNHNADICNHNAGGGKGIINATVYYETHNYYGKGNT